MRPIDTICVTGTVGTDPRLRAGDSGLEIASFRLASNRDRYNRETGQWEQQPANWYTVSAYRSLAVNVAACLTKGERVVVSGRLRISRWESGDKQGTSVEIDADSVGLDLTFSGAARLASARKSDSGASGRQDAAGAAASSSPAGGVFPPAPSGDAFLPGEETGSWPTTAPGSAPEATGASGAGDGAGDSAEEAEEREPASASAP